MRRVLHRRYDGRSRCSIPTGIICPIWANATHPPAKRCRLNGGWVLIERTRQATQLMDDLRRFKAALVTIDDPEALPPAVRVLLQPPADSATTEAYPSYRGVSTVPGVTSSDGSGHDLFFPMSFNREQVEVIQRLATRPGVVVQGPPGTGKNPHHRQYH